MVDVEQAVDRIRAIRDFANTPLPEDDLNAILDAGRRAGSSKNLQRWHFIVVRERATLQRLAGVGEFAGHLASGAAGVAIVIPDPHEPGAPLSITWDSGRAAQNMMLVAWGRGIGSVPATVYDQPLCRSILGYPNNHHCEYVLNFGYPREVHSARRAPRKGGRRAFDDVVHWDRW